MTRTALKMGLAVVLLAGLSVPASAATANFQANCQLDIPTPCVFDANRAPDGQSATSCGSASVDQYFWDFGDGTSFFTTSSFVSHTYDQSYCDTDMVSLAVFCDDNSSASKTHCYCITVGIKGCIRPGAGWTP